MFKSKFKVVLLYIVICNVTWERGCWKTDIFVI